MKKINKKDTKITSLQKEITRLTSAKGACSSILKTSLCICLTSLCLVFPKALLSSPSQKTNTLTLNESQLLDDLSFIGGCGICAAIGSCTTATVGGMIIDNKLSKKKEELAREYNQ